ncbi:MAG: hypothetical protein AAGB01_00920 [Cyanobacteria bacterium P01_F01_bin.42]
MSKSPHEPAVESLPPDELINQWLQCVPRSADADVTQALLRLEKKSRRSIVAQDFYGAWRLTFVVSKQALKSEHKVGKMIPGWLDIRLFYEPALESGSRTDQPSGPIVNQVGFGALRLELRGPWKYYGRKQMMAFDFLELGLGAFGKSLLSIPVRGGQQAASQFEARALKDHAFFRYFWVTPQAIAARGRGGGLALWRRVES